MKPLLVSILFIFIHCSNIYASDFVWPNANDFVFPEYETQIIKKLETEINISIVQSKVMEYVVNFKFDLATHCDKLYSIMIINLLASNLEKNVDDIYFSQQPFYVNFISENEISNSFDDISVLNKLKTWILLRPGKFDLDKISDNEWNNMKNRRKKILEDIAKNNTKYAPIAHYLLTVVDSKITIPQSPVDVIQQKITAINEFIKNYANTEFALMAKVYIINQHFCAKEYEKAIKQSEEIIKNNKNFYIGPCDLYSAVYRELLNVYSKLNEKEKIKFVIEKINKQSQNYDAMMKFYTLFISK